jgi:hypothetical protein
MLKLLVPFKFDVLDTAEIIQNFDAHTYSF